MKKLLFLAVLLLAAGSALALPSYSGLRGLNRVVDARTEEAGFLSLGLFTFMGVSPDERTAQLSTGTEEVTDTEYNGTGYLTIGYSASSHFELGANVSYVMNQLRREDVGNRLDITGDWDGDDGFSEAGLSLKYTFNPESENMWFGLMPWFKGSIYQGGDNSYVYNGDGWDGIWQLDEPMFQMRRPMINAGSMSFGGEILASFDLKPVVLHANLGYAMYSQNFTFTDRRFDGAGNVIATEAVDMDVDDPAISVRGGIEYPMGSTTLFAEVEWRRFLDREFEEGDGERYDDYIQVAPGARFSFDNGLAFDVTGSFCLSDFDPEYNDLGHRYFQAGQTLTEEERARYAPFPGGYAPKYGLGINLMYMADLNAHPSILSGTVTNAVTGETINNAQVSFPGSEVESVERTSNGAYSVQINKGSYNILAEADGYVAASEAIEVPSGENITQNFELMPMMGTVTGTVTDSGSGLPLTATVAETGSNQTVTDVEGNYSIQCGAGATTLLATVDGYSNQSRTVQVPAGDSVVQDFEMHLELSFDNVYFDYDMHNIRPDAEIILNQVAEALIGNPGVVIMITGNTDSDGAPEYNEGLAENRAMAVRNYLIAQGVNEASLSTVAYGEEKPVAPNNTDENKALNRRAEFIILGAPIE